LQLLHVLAILLKIHDSNSPRWACPHFCSSVASVAAAVNNIYRATLDPVSEATRSSHMQQPELAQAAAACSSLCMQLLPHAGSALQELSVMLKIAHVKPQFLTGQKQQQQHQQQQQQHAQPTQPPDQPGVIHVLLHMAHNFLMFVDACLFPCWQSGVIDTTSSSSGSSSSSSSGGGTGSNSISIRPVLLAAADLANTLFKCSAHYSSAAYDALVAARLEGLTSQQVAPAAQQPHASAEGHYRCLAAAAVRICLCCGPAWGPGSTMQHQPPLCTDHRLMRLAITLFALVTGLQEGGTQPAASTARSSSSGSSSRGESSSSGRSTAAKDPKAAATPAAAATAGAAAAGSSVAADSLTPAVELSQQLWQQLGLPLCSWDGFVEAWGHIHPQLRSILEAILQSSGDSSGSGGLSSGGGCGSSGVAAGCVVRPEAVQGALVAWLAQSLNYGLMYASTGA
jgi:hypothetical protein